MISFWILYLTVILLWLPYKHKDYLWFASLFFACAAGLRIGVLDFVALLPIITFGLTAYCFYKFYRHIPIRVISGLILFFLGFGLVLHYLPGFHNIKYYHDIYVSKDAYPVLLYLNFDKTVVGVFLIGFMRCAITKKQEIVETLKATLPRLLLVILIVALLALLLKIVSLELKFPSIIYMWALTHLLFISFAEEAFYRGFIQTEIAKSLHKIKYKNAISIAIASTLFGLSHYPAGLEFTLFSMVAGVGYGWVYLKTNRIEAAMLTHFSLNLTHGNVTFIPNCNK